MNELAAASVAYDAKGWQPEFIAFIPQMTVEMFLGSPFAAEFRKLAANPDGFPALVKKLIALERREWPFRHLFWRGEARPVLAISPARSQDSCSTLRLPL